MHLFWDPYWTVCSSVIYFFEIASITASYCLNSFNKHVNSVNIVNAVNIANIVNIFSNVSGSFETPGFLRSQIFGDPKNICIQEFLNVQKSFEQKLFKKNHQFWYCQFNAKNPSPVNIYIFNPVKVFFSQIHFQHFYLRLGYRNGFLSSKYTLLCWFNWIWHILYILMVPLKSLCIQSKSQFTFCLKCSKICILSSLVHLDQCSL